MSGGSQPEVEASQKLQWLETRYDLLKYKLDGWCVWPLFRFPIGLRLQNFQSDRAKARRFSRARTYRQLLRDVISLARPRPAKLLIKTFSSNQTELDNGLRADVYFDDVLTQLDSFYKIETLNNPDFPDASSLYRTPRDTSTFGLDRLSRTLMPRSDPRLLELGERLGTAIREGLEMALDPQKLAMELAAFEGQRRAYRWLLSRIRPSDLMIADAGDHGLIAAARELGVRVIELQHGIMHRNALSTSWTRYAHPYKGSMPLPNKVLLYGPYWRDELAANQFWTDELRSVGSTRIDRYRARGLSRSDDVCTMVLTTQGVETSHIITFLQQFAEVSKTRLRFHLYIKMHPAQATDAATYQEAFRGRTDIEIVSGASSLGTFDLIARSHLHLSIFSTCHYEALALGVPTVVLPMVGSELMQSLVEAGDAYRPESPADLLDLATRYKELRVPKSLGDRYFARGAVQNILAELE